jgi:predicted transcriptional regulator YdeE
MNTPEDFSATVIEIPELHLVVSKAKEFPDDIKGSWQRLESKLPSLKGRKFYGLTFFKDGELIYYAALETEDAKEITSLGFPVMTVDPGKYAKVKLQDWEKHGDQIGEIFEDLRSRYVKDSSRPDIEFYRSQTELHLMMPITE